MARKKRDPDPNPFETRLVAMTVKAIKDEATCAVLIYETPDNTVKLLAAPAQIAVRDGLISRALAAIRDGDATPSE